MNYKNFTDIQTHESIISEPLQDYIKFPKQNFNYLNKLM